MCSVKRVLAALGLFHLLVGTLYAQDTSLSVDSAIQVVESFESKIKSVKFSARSNDGNAQFEVAVDSDFRFRLEGGSLGRVVTGDFSSAGTASAPRTVGERTVLTFDGKVFRSQMEQNSGGKVPAKSTEPAQGSVKASDQSVLFQHQSAIDSLRYFFPFFAPIADWKVANSLSAYLRLHRAHDMKVEDTADGQLVFRTLHHQL